MNTPMNRHRRRALQGLATTLSLPLVGCSTGVSMSTTSLEDTIAEAFVYAFPLYEMARTRWNALDNPANPARARPNVPGHRRALTDHRSRAVTTPNNDTLYSSCWVDLSAGPVRLQVAPLPAGRYRLRCQEPDLTLSADDEHEITAFSTTRVTLAVGIGRTLNLQFAPPEEVPFVAAERLHAQVLDASGAVVHQRVLRRAPISKPRQYDYYVTLPTGSYRVQAHTDGGLRFAMELQVAAEPMRREIEVPLVAR